jgi:hypothetical protein
VIFSYCVFVLHVLKLQCVYSSTKDWREHRAKQSAHVELIRAERGTYQYRKRSY